MRSAPIVYSFLNINSSGRQIELRRRRGPSYCTTAKGNGERKRSVENDRHMQNTDCGRAIITKSTFVARPSIKRLRHGDLKEVLFFWNDPCANQRRIAVSKKNCRGCCRRETNQGRTGVKPSDADGRRSFFIHLPNRLGVSSHSRSPLPTPVGPRNASCVQDKNKAQKKIDRSIWLGGLWRCFVLERGSRIMRDVYNGVVYGSW